MTIQTGIVTVSDRAARGLYKDLSGPALEKAVRSYGWMVASVAVVPDRKTTIQRAVRSLVACGCQLVLTTGGTGIGPRDVTPEALRALRCRELPGFGEIMRRESMKITPNAALSRCMAGVFDRALVVCLPGKPSAAVECLRFVADVIPHCLEMLGGLPHAAEGP